MVYISIIFITNVSNLMELDNMIPTFCDWHWFQQGWHHVRGFTDSSDRGYLKIRIGYCDCSIILQEQWSLCLHNVSSSLVLTCLYTIICKPTLKSSHHTSLTIYVNTWSKWVTSKKILQTMYMRWKRNKNIKKNSTADSLSIQEVPFRRWNE